MLSLVSLELNNSLLCRFWHSFNERGFKGCKDSEGETRLVMEGMERLLHYHRPLPQLNSNLQQPRKSPAAPAALDPCCSSQPPPRSSQQAGNRGRREETETKK